MLITFKSKAAADVIMYEEHAKRILDLLGKDLARGVITAEEAVLAVSRLEGEIAQSKRPAAEEGEDEHEPSRQAVSFATRVYPLLEMLRAAARKRQPVAWGI
jgi:hypothetical protein